MASSGSPMQALVRFTFTAEDEGELSVQQGDVVVVVPQSEQPEGWIFVHRSDGQAGFVPVNYLQFQPTNVNKATVNAPIANTNMLANNAGTSNNVNNMSNMSANGSGAINNGAMNNNNNNNNTNNSNNNSSLQNTIAQLRGLALNGNNNNINNNNSTNFNNNNGNSGNNKNNISSMNNLNSSVDGMSNVLNNANGLCINTSNPGYSSPGAPISAVSPSIAKNTNNSNNSSATVSNPRALLQESSRMLKASKQIKNALTATKTPLSASVSKSNSSANNSSNNNSSSANNAAGLFSIVTLLEKGNFDELIPRHDDCFNRLSQIQLDSFQSLIEVTDGASKKIGEATKESQDLADALVRLEERIDEERRKLKQQNEYEKNADILGRSKVNENVDSNISSSLPPSTNASKSGSVGSSTNNNASSVNTNSISSSNLLSTGKWQLNTNA